MSDHVCMSDECERLVRAWPDPAPDDFYVMWSESIVGRPLYCQECFDELEENPE
jgi:hypothetical protein